MKQINAYKLFHEGSLILAEAERQGIRVDVTYIKEQRKKLEKRITSYIKRLKQTTLYKNWYDIYYHTTNIDSNAQLERVLYRKMKIKTLKETKSGKGSTDEETLKSLSVDGLNYLLKIRKLKKITNTYLKSFEREQIDGFIHPFFNLNTVRTYRSSSDRPNFQNIPKRDKEFKDIIRSSLYPRYGHQLLEVDYSGLEVSIAACYHKDPNMLKYLEDLNSDMHGDSAKDIFCFGDEFNKNEYESHNLMRSAAKNGFVFPQFYGDYYGNNANSLCEWVNLPKRKWKSKQGIELGMGSFWPTHISDHLIENGIKSFDHFLQHLKSIEDKFWNERFPIYKQWRDNWYKEYQQKGWFQMHTGFVCKGLMTRNEVTNYPVQGAAFHCLLWSFIELSKYIKKKNLKTKLIGQIHDAMILDVHPDELNEIAIAIYNITCVELKKQWDWICVPLEVEADLCDVDQPWSKKQEYKLIKG